MKFAVIPARGGSKRIPRKNVLEFHGKPLIAWSIEAAKLSNMFDRIVVSTDDSEISEIANRYGAEAQFKRPVVLADDFSTTGDVMAHAAAWLDNEYSAIDAICCIYPTAPFVTSFDLIAGYQALCSGDWLYAFSATRFNVSVFRSFIQDGEGGVEMLFPEHYRTRSQDLPDSLHDAAQFYWGKPDAWINNKRIFANHSIPVQIPDWRVVDIDTPEDLDKAKALAPKVYQRLSS